MPYLWNSFYFSASVRAHFIFPLTQAYVSWQDGVGVPVLLVWTGKGAVLWAHSSGLWSWLYHCHADPPGIPSLCMWHMWHIQGPFLLWKRKGTILPPTSQQHTTVTAVGDIHVFRALGTGALTSSLDGLGDVGLWSMSRVGFPLLLTSKPIFSLQAYVTEKKQQAIFVWKLKLSSCTHFLHSCLYSAQWPSYHFGCTLRLGSLFTPFPAGG